MIATDMTLDWRLARAPLDRTCGLRGTVLADGRAQHLQGNHSSLDLVSYRETPCGVAL